MLSIVFKLLFYSSKIQLLAATIDNSLQTCQGLKLIICKFKLFGVIYFVCFRFHFRRLLYLL